MSLIDGSIYELNKPEGQLQALQDIIDEHNDQFDRSSAATTYNVVGYRHMVVDLINGSPTGVYRDTYVHGLGYPPVFLPFLIVAGPNTWAPEGYLEINFAPGGLLNDSAYFSADSQNIYFNVFARNLGGFFATTHWEAGIYVFDIPLNI